MATRYFTKEIKDYILSEIARHDLVSVDDIAKIIYYLHIYNAETAEFQWCRDKARRLMASWKDKDGIRVLFAAGPASGKFINIETCSEVAKLNAVELQLTKKRNGLNTAIEKNDRCKAALTGKAPLRRMIYGDIPFIDIADFL